MAPSLYPITPWSASFEYGAAVISTPRRSFSPQRARFCCASQGPGLPLCSCRVLRDVSPPCAHGVYVSPRRENGDAHFCALQPVSTGLTELSRITRLAASNFRFRLSSFPLLMIFRRNLCHRPSATVDPFRSRFVRIDQRLRLPHYLPLSRPPKNPPIVYSPKDVAGGHTWNGWPSHAAPIFLPSNLAGWFAAGEIAMAIPVSAARPLVARPIFAGRR